MPDLLVLIILVLVLVAPLVGRHIRSGRVIAFLLRSQDVRRRGIRFEKILRWKLLAFVPHQFQNVLFGQRLLMLLLLRRFNDDHLFG